jgi:hypothetical protein
MMVSRNKRTNETLAHKRTNWRAKTDLFKNWMVIFDNFLRHNLWQKEHHLH